MEMQEQPTIHLWMAIIFAINCAPEESSGRLPINSYTNQNYIEDTITAGTNGELGAGGISGGTGTIPPSSGMNPSLTQPGQPGQPTEQDPPEKLVSVEEGQDPNEEILCGSVKVDADVEILKENGNLLVVFDRSGSMGDPWGGVTRFQAAGNALISALTPLQDELTVGGVFYPSAPDIMATTCNIVDPLAWIPGGDCLNLVGATCEVTDITAADQINFIPAAQFISQLPNHWFLSGAGMTPLELAVTKADAALSTATLTGTIAVVIMTDGAPTCGDIVANVNNMVANWASRGIKTYVVGLPGSAGASAILSQIATAGGTNQFIEPSDPAALQAKFSTIATETIKRGINSCVINLVQTEDADMEKLQMIVMENGQEMSVPRDMGNGAGWSVTPDGTVATLEGSICEDAKTGRFDSVRFDFGCMDLPVLN